MRLLFRRGIVAELPIERLFLCFDRNAGIVCSPIGVDIDSAEAMRIAADITDAGKVGLHQGIVSAA